MIVIGEKYLVEDIEYVFSDKFDRFLIIEDWSKIIDLIFLHRKEAVICVKERKKFISYAKAYDVHANTDFYFAETFFELLNEDDFDNASLFKRVYNAKHRKYCVCDKSLCNCEITHSGDVYLCCSSYINAPIGSIKQSSLHTCWNSTTAKILRLSTLNGTFCFCSKEKCQYVKECVENTPMPKLKMSDYPIYLNIAIDNSCNLACKSCRKTREFATPQEIEERMLLAEKIENEVWDKVPYLYIAGNGEAFLSQVYLELLLHNKSHTFPGQLTILTNGLLFDNTVFDSIKIKFPNINMMISIDAATDRTYNQLRGGNFGILKDKLKEIALKRKNNDIQSLGYRFVVQIENYLEMEDFISLAKDNAADFVDFIRLVKCDAFSEDYFLKNSLLDYDGRLKEEYHEWFSNELYKGKNIFLDSSYRIDENA